MKLKDAIQVMTQLAAQDLKGGDVELVLYDTNRDIEYSADPEGEIDFEITRGEGEIVIEFKGHAGAPGSTGPR